MPELSDSQRRKMAELDPRFAKARLVDAVELKWEIVFRCTVCGTSKSWRRDTMLGRARTMLNMTMAEIQRRVPCPRCGAHMPAMAQSGVWDPQDHAERFKWEAIEALRAAGLNPLDYGYGWRPPAAGR
jgi:ribosomal protein L37AE/L43A